MKRSFIQGLQGADDSGGGGAKPRKRQQAEEADPNPRNLGKLKVMELKARLQERGLPVTGKKAELVQRLSEAMAAPAAIGEGGLADALAVARWKGALKQLGPKEMVALVKKTKEFFQGDEPPLSAEDAKRICFAASGPRRAAADRVQQLLRAWQPDAGSVVDGSAGAGAQTLVFARSYGRVTAFEGDEDSYRYLRHNVGVLGHGNVAVASTPLSAVDFARVECDVVYVSLVCGGADASADAVRFEPQLAALVGALRGRAKLLALELPREYDWSPLKKGFKALGIGTKTAAVGRILDLCAHPELRGKLMAIFLDEGGIADAAARCAQRTQAAAAAAVASAPPAASVAPTAAQSHYNQQVEVTRTQRQQSSILHLKNFNNWVKRFMLAAFIKDHASVVLDLSCGRGGDIQKYCARGSRARYIVASDIAEQSLYKYVDRYEETAACTWGVKLMHADAAVHDIHANLNLQFDLVSCQFALHYGFETEAKARCWVRNACHRLKIGGHFIGTTTDGNVLVKRLRQADGRVFGNSKFKVTFDEAVAQGSFPAAQPYGLGFTFHLNDAIDDCPEYLVHFPTLVALAAEHGCKLVCKKNLHELYDDCKRGRPMFGAARAADVSQEAQRWLHAKVEKDQREDWREEWEAIHCYCLFVFEKVSCPACSSNPCGCLRSDVPASGKHRLARSDVVNLF